MATTIRLKIERSEYDALPEIAVVEKSKALVSQIRQLASLAKTVGASEICVPNHALTLSMRDWDQEGLVLRSPEDDEERNLCQANFVELVVTPISFFWRGKTVFEGALWETEASFVDFLGKPPRQENPTLGIIVEGGVIQAVISDGPLPQMDIVVIDYDVDGSDENLLCPIGQQDGRTEMADISWRSVEDSSIDLKAVVDFLDRSASQGGNKDALCR